jgi:hypothetical protein
MKRSSAIPAAQCMGCTDTTGLPPGRGQTMRLYYIGFFPANSAHGTGTAALVVDAETPHLRAIHALFIDGLLLWLYSPHSGENQGEPGGQYHKAAAARGWVPRYTL